MAIWGKQEIPVVGVTGEIGSGKTLFLLDIDPENTIYYDFELSGATYDFPGERVDVGAEMLKKYPTGYSPVAVYDWWVEHVMNLPKGKYSVIAVDTIGDLEDGLAEYVKSKYRDFGYSSAQSFQKTGGIFHKEVRSYWKTVLVNVSARCETFAFSAHLRNVWEDGEPTKKREPVGKRTLMELASMYFWLERQYVKNGKVHHADEPSGKKLKGRLVARLETGKWSQVLPDRMPICTPDAIRNYVANPVGSRKPKNTELVDVEDAPDNELEALRLKALIAQREAEAKREANELFAASQAAIDRKKAKEAAADESVKPSPKPEPEPEPEPEPKPEPEAPAADPPSGPELRDAADAAEAAIARREAKAKEELPAQPAPSSEEGDPESTSASEDSLRQLRELKTKLELNNDKWRAILARFRVKTAHDLSEDDVQQLIVKLLERLEQKKLAKATNEWAENL